MFPADESYKLKTALCPGTTGLSGHHGIYYVNDGNIHVHVHIHCRCYM